MSHRHKEVVDWILVILFLIWGTWFLRRGHYISTILLWIGAFLLLPYLGHHFKKRWNFHFYDQFKWPVLVVLLSFLMVYTQMTVPLVKPEVIIIEREVFAPEVQRPAEIVVASPGEMEIRIIDGGFSPQEVAVVAGTTITWKNTWSVHVLHVYQLNGKYINVAQSDKLGLGDSFSYTFEKPGIYQFRDLYFGWKGKVHVN